MAEHRAPSTEHRAPSTEQRTALMAELNEQHGTPLCFENVELLCEYMRDQVLEL